ncbi:MAG: peptide chain release factor N(5)-glutamine methyltransferase [Candidatus Margulisbacteria bacterium]|nr:peptide chain release factor N(5)-glutamine methyltransferase [Candidatus Margulisiibacteriota bacterium]
MNLTEAIDWGTDQLTAKQIEEARLEAEILLVHDLGIKKSELILNQSLAIDDKAFKRYKELIARRLKHEPTAYITGYQPFMSLDFMVNRSVLIPRPETEILVETVIKSVRSSEFGVGSFVIADIGTGSGAIAVSLAKNLSGIKMIGIDSSSEALKVAQKNAEVHRVADRCQFIKGNLLEPLKEKINIIVANPPYIPSAEIGKLQPEVKDWEPKQALDGGKDGLDYVRKLIDQASNHLSTQPPNYLFLEFGFGQAGAVESLAKVKFKNVEIIKDYAGIPRILKAA